MLVDLLWQPGHETRLLYTTQTVSDQRSVGVWVEHPPLIQVQTSQRMSVLSLSGDAALSSPKSQVSYLNMAEGYGQHVMRCHLILKKGVYCETCRWCSWHVINSSSPMILVRSGSSKNWPWWGRSEETSPKTLSSWSTKFMNNTESVVSIIYPLYPLYTNMF